jgi:hypothetical protein
LAQATAFGQAATEIFGILQDGADGLAAIVDFKPVPLDKMQAFASDIGQFMSLVLQAAAQFTSVQLGTIKAFSQNVVQAVQDISDAIDALSSLGSVTGDVGKLVAAFTAAVSDLVSKFQAAVLPNAQSLGAAIIDGIVAGINANAAKIRDALLAVVNSALAAVKGALQIASPSKVFADQIGAPIAEGIMLGVQTKALALSSAMSVLTGNAIAGASNAVSNTTNYNVNANYGYQDERSVRDDLVLLSMLNR